MIIRILTVGLCLLSCTAKTTQFAYASQEFQVINYEKTFQLKVDSFVKNDAYCFTEGIPYALVIGKPMNYDLPERLSVLLKCDNNSYQIGQVLNIQPISDPTKETSLRPIYFVKDTLVNGRKTRFIIGTENPSIWGHVIKDD